MIRPGVVVRTFNPGTQDTGRWISDFHAIFVYRMYSRTPRITQRNLFLGGGVNDTKRRKLNVTE